MNKIEKNIGWIVPILSIVMILIFPKIRVYTIIISIILVAFTMCVKSKMFLFFIKKSWYIFLLVFVAFLFGVFYGSDKFWCDFELSSILLTVLYSIFIYVTLYRDKTVVKVAILKAFPFLIAGIILILFSVIASVGEGINIELGNGTKFFIDGSRKSTLGLLLLGTLFYAMVNFTMMKGESTYKDMYVKSLQYSDIPVVITFLLLWGSTFELKESIQYEAFYGGVIAFQMLYSNIVWSFIDDPIIEKMFNDKNK